MITFFFNPLNPTSLQPHRASQNPPSTIHLFSLLPTSKSLRLTTITIKRLDSVRHVRGWRSKILLSEACQQFAGINNSINLSSSQALQASRIQVHTNHLLLQFFLSLQFMAHCYIPQKVLLRRTGMSKAEPKEV